MDPRPHPDVRPAVRPALLALALCALPAAAPAQVVPVDFRGSTKAGVDANGAPVQDGDLLEWTIVVRNRGLSDAVAVVVRDAVAPTQEFVSADRGGAYDAATRTVTWDAATTPELALLVPGGTEALRLTTRYRAPAPPVPACDQAVIDASNNTLFGPTPTDDPATAAPGDPTCLVDGPAPLRVDSIEPCRGTKRGGTVVVVAGSGFAPGTRLFLDDAEATVTSLASDRIEATTGEHPSVGSVDVLVRRPDGTDAVLPGGWVYTPVPFPIRLHGSRSAGQVWLVWTDNGQGPWVVERSQDPLFGCGAVLVRAASAPEHRDDGAGGDLLFYRVE